MPPVKLSHVVSFTSEDPRHRVENLISGGMWLSNPTDQSGTIKAEFQIERATSINYIDIGNHNSAMVCIEVGMSSWCHTQQYLSLLPTVVLMKPTECRSGQNMNAVRMFKRDSLDEENVSKKWDRIRVTCSQLFRRNCQFGLAFIKLFYDEETPAPTYVTPLFKKNETKELATKSLPFKLQGHHPLKTPREGAARSLFSKSVQKSTQNSRAEQLVMARKHIPNGIVVEKAKEALEREVLGYLISMNLTEYDIRCLSVSHLLEEFECNKGRKLTPPEQIVFKNITKDYTAERINKLKNESNCDNDLLILSSDEEKENPPKQMRKFTFKRIESKNDKIMNKIISPKSFNRSALADRNVIEGNVERKRNRSFEREDDDSLFKLRKVAGDSSIFNGKKWLYSKTVKIKPPDSTQNRVSCPMCSSYFSNDLIASHAFTCCGKVSEPEVATIFDPTQPSTSGLNKFKEKCPVCGERFESPILKSHAEECADRMFGTHHYT